MRSRLLGLVAAGMLVGGSLGAIEPRPPGELVGYITIGKSPDFLKQWFETPPEHAPRLPLVSRFSPGEIAHIAFVLTGQRADDNGRCHVTVDIRIAKPDGTVLFDQEAVARFLGESSGRPGFVMANPMLEVGFEAGDPLGQYSVVAIFHDDVAKKAHIAEMRLELVAKTEPDESGRKG
jgi:hypothetical protein